MISELLKSLKFKKDFTKFLESLTVKNLTDEGKSSVLYLDEFLRTESRTSTISDIRKEFQLFFNNKQAFKDASLVEGMIENSLKSIGKKVNVTSEAPNIEEAPQVEEMPVVEKEEVTLEDKKVSELTQDEIFELCGYRYVYPVFPQEIIDTEVLEEETEFVRLDGGVEEIQDLYEKSFEEGNDVVVMMYFPKYERDYDLDAHNVLPMRNISKRDLLKSYGGSFPQNLDIQNIVHMDNDTMCLMTVSLITGLPYCISLGAYAETNEELKCRVTQNGLDYQFYQVK